MLLADLVATTEAVRATRARSAKVAALADLLRRLEPEERLPATALLIGEARQGKVGIGWATVAEAGEGVPPAAEPSLTVTDLDATLDAVAVMSGPGSGGARVAAIRSLFSRATEAEAELLRRLLLGDLRQGALEGVMADAVAKAAGVPAAVVRRAAMLAGDLGRAATVALAGGAEALAAVGLRVLTPVQPMLAATAADVGRGASTGCGRRRRWSGSSTAPASRSTATATRCALFTRNLNEVTDRLPASSTSCGRSRRVGRARRRGARRARRRPPGRFQDTMRRFGSRVAAARARLGVCFFDVLHVDGDDLLDEPLTRALDVLDESPAPWRIPGIVTADPDEAAAFLDDALGRRPRGRDGEGASTPLRGRPAGQGVAQGQAGPHRSTSSCSPPSGATAGARAGCRTSTSAPATRRRRLRDGGQDVQGPDRRAAARGRPSSSSPARSAATASSSHVRPELVVEIALDGVQVSTRYPGGVALRFARVRRYRTDKARPRPT